MAGGYKDGLLDKNFMDTDAKRITAIMGNGEGGSAFGSAGGDFGKWIPALLQTNPSAEFIPVKYPVMNKGDRPMTGQRTSPAGTFGAAISKDSKNIELAARLLDYGYGDAGHMLYNFGVEGVSYTMKDNIPTYTDIITDEAKNGGLGIGPAMGKYQRACYNGPFVQDKHYIYQFYSLEPQKLALDAWSDTDAMKYKLPQLSMTVEETREYNRITNDVDKFREEYFYKTVAGQNPISEFDKFYAGLKDRGIEDAIKIQQAAYDRFLSN
jgi:putative aldouronate transport system substrate-binding protein